MARIIHVDGTEKELAGKPSLEELQKAVGGYIEVAEIPGSSKILVVNEEGLLQQLPLNPSASAMALQLIVGDVVLCNRADLD